ncbi:MAG TPA: glycosyltransferase family 4 protein [Verrucomicrobiae bacterium]|nr:glycosyltransferase family 4 protein [Verrucomicrobiae bacterium]
MKILMLHNSYQFHGGEDESFASEERMLADAGHFVDTIHVKNENVEGLGAVSVALQSIWSRSSYERVDRKLREAEFDVLHVQNFFPLLSPSVYAAAKKNRVAVVQTLRNYRLLCPSTVLYRNGKICEDCLHKTVKYPGVVHGCYRGSILSSGAVAAMTAIHAARGTWRRDVDLYISLTEFSREKFVEAGFAPEKIIVKSNFVYPDPGEGDGAGDYLVFAGRFTREKGIETLLAAWERVKKPGKLKIVGEGPLAWKVEKICGERSDVEWLGQKSPEEVKGLLGGARAVVFPSEWYEPFGRVAIESFAKGTPVIASRLAGLAEIVRDGETGLHFRAGDAQDLAEKIDWALEHPAEMRAMRGAARASYEQNYTAEKNCEALIRAYQKARKSFEVANQACVTVSTTN